MDEMNVMVNETVEETAVEETTAIVPAETETNEIETNHVNKGLAIAGGLGLIGLGYLAIKQGPKVVNAIKSKHASNKQKKTEKEINDFLTKISEDAEARALCQKRMTEFWGENQTAEPIKVEVDVEPEKEETA